MIFELVLFSMLGAMMFCSKIIMELFPNIHLIGMFCVLITVVFRFKALIPIYIFVLITGVYAGFAFWWIPYLYIWLPLWTIAMLIPRRTPRWLACIIYPLICALHGLAYGTLYAPAQALMYGLDFDGMIAWIVAGLPFDAIHSLGNLAAGLLVYPLSELMLRLLRRANI